MRSLRLCPAFAMFDQRRRWCPMPPGGSNNTLQENTSVEGRRTCTIDSAGEVGRRLGGRSRWRRTGCPGCGRRASGPVPTTTPSSGAMVVPRKATRGGSGRTSSSRSRPGSSTGDGHGRTASSYTREYRGTCSCDLTRNDHLNPPEPRSCSHPTARRAPGRSPTARTKPYRTRLRSQTAARLQSGAPYASVVG
jgi:hypothetical protein